MEFRKKLFLSTTTCLGACLVIAKITAGSVYLHDCPINKMIAVYVLVPGGLLVLLPVVFWMVVYRGNEKLLVWTAAILYGLFCFGWFISGIVWVFPAASHVTYNVTLSRQTYCDGDIFKFALSLSVIDCLIVGCSLIGFLIWWRCRDKLYEKCNSGDQPGSIQPDSIETD